MFLPQPRHPQKAPEVHSGVAQQFATLIELKINDLDDTIHRNRNPTSSMLYIPLCPREINCEFQKVRGSTENLA